LFALLHTVILTNNSIAIAYNTCIAPQVTYRDFRGTGAIYKLVLYA